MYRLYNGVKEKRKKENIKDETIQTKLQADTHNNNKKGKRKSGTTAVPTRGQKGRRNATVTTAVSGDSSWILMSAA